MINIPISKVSFGEEEEELVLEVLRSGQIAQGVYVEKFEKIFADLHQVKHALAVNNGTTALVAALQALEIGPGSEVITSPFTFVATLNAILETGATARFADIGSDFNVIPEQMSALVNERTKVLMPVHLYGYMADMQKIMEIAIANDLRVVEDAAQAVYADYGLKKAGSFDVGCFSLYATKNLTTGEGGVVTTNDDVVADKLRLLRNQGMRERYQYEMAGHNYRLTNLAAALGIPQLERVHQSTEKRRRNAERLTEGLSSIDGLEVPRYSDGARSHVFHQYTILLNDSAPITRDQLMTELNSRGVGCGIYYPRVVFDYECYKNDPRVIKDPVPGAFDMAQRVLSLPVHPYLTDSEIDYIIESIQQVCTK